MESNTNKKIRSGGIWSLFQNGGNQIIGFLLGIVLARVLIPEDFGKVAMIMVFIGFASFLQNFGFGEALIQLQKVNPIDYSTVFWFNVFTGVILFGLFFFGSSVIGIIYANNELVILTKYLSFNFLINALSSVHSTILTKEFKFKQLAIINLITNPIMYAVAIPMALLNYGVMALIWGSLIQNLGRTLLLWLVATWSPAFIFSKASFKKLFKFGIFVFLQSPLGYISRNIDNFMIGKLSGDASLGLYNKAYQVMLLPVKNISNSLKQVMFPAMSEAQEDLERLQMLYLRSTRIVAFISFPIMLGIWATAKPFIIGVYGLNWAGAIPLLQVLSIVGAFQSLITFVGTGYYAIGKPQIQLYLNIVTTPVLISLFYLGYRLNGLMGMVWFYLFFTILVGLVSMSILFRLFEISWATFLKNIAPLIFINIAMALSVKGFGLLPFIQIQPEIVQLFVLAFFGFVMYLGLNLFFKVDTFFDFANQIPMLKKLPLLKWYFQNYEKSIN